MQVAMANQIIDQQYRRRISKESTLSDLPEEQAQLLANFRAVPDSEFVRLEVPAIVVMEPGPSETPPPLSELTELGTLNLMVTDVTQAFPRFSELTGGRSSEECTLSALQTPRACSGPCLRVIRTSRANQWLNLLRPSQWAASAR